MSSSRSNRQGDNSPKKQHHWQDVSRLMRIRDFILLILSYPTRIGYEGLLNSWIRRVSELTAWYCRIMELPEDTRSLIDFKDFRESAGRLLNERPLRLVEGIIPEDITRRITNGDSIIFNESKSEELTPASSSTSSETQPNHVPQPILHLATCLALGQLTQFCDETFTAKTIWFSTRNDTEKHTVVRTMQEYFQSLQRQVLVYDASKNISEEMGRIELARIPVLLVDGDVDENLDLLQKHSHEINSHIVFVTTQSSTQQLNELTYEVDLGICTEDHLLCWQVFCRIVGIELVHSSKAIQQIAVQIVEECGSHLLAIVFAAKSLRDVNDAQIWKRTLKKLRYPNPSYNISESKHESEVAVNAFINIVWADLIPERKKLRFTQCLRAFKSVYSVRKIELFARWFFEQSVVSEEEAEHTLRELVETSILRQYEDDYVQYIQFPEELKIALDALLRKESHDNLTEGVLGLTEPPKVWVPHEAKKFPRNFFTRDLNLSYSGTPSLSSFIFELAQLKSLSLKGCKQLKQLPPEIERLACIGKLDLSETAIAHLPPSLNLPNLLTLMLGDNLDLMEIPASFFVHMPLLRLLDLSRTSIHDLPSSFFNLGELREFYLKDCDLFIELSSEIAQLKGLIILDLHGTQITHLPNQIQELTILRRLALSFSEDHHDSGDDKKCISSSSSAMNPLAFISKFALLEVLRIDVDPNDVWWHKNVERILAEIFKLRNLRILDIYIPEVKLLIQRPWYLSYFRLIVGHHMQRIISRVPHAVEVKFKESSPSLKFVNGVDFPDEVKINLCSASAFFLDRHMTINDLSQFGFMNLQWLELCILAECNEMQSIFDRDDEDSMLPESFFLKFLTIFYMKNLRSIISRPTLGKSPFWMLKFLALHTCPELTTIFTIHFLHSLVNLEELIVEDCPKVSSIISCQSSEPIEGIFLPRLRKLSLVYVPELVSISNGVRIGRNLEKMGFYYCPKLESLSAAELSSEKLKVIRGEVNWWEALQWSKADWGEEGRPHKFNHTFIPIDEDLDILTQLTAYNVASFNEDYSGDILSFNEDYIGDFPPYSPLDKIEAQVKKEKKEEKLVGDPASTKFVPEISLDDDEDPIIKSIVESSGPVLSKDWKQVRSKKVEGSPSGGMELKKWEY